MRTILIAALLAAVVATLIGCSNSSGPSESQYLEPSSPENVLLNLERAYTERPCASRPTTAIISTDSPHCR